MVKNKQVLINKIEKTIKQTIEKYALLTKNEKVLVAASGGKDSTVILYVLKKLGYKIEALTINAFIENYSKQNLTNLEQFCKDYNIKLHRISLKKEFGCSLCYIKTILNKKGIKLSSCAICGVLRRYLLNKYARKLKAAKLVLGHNLDDEAQVIMMNFIRGDLPVSARLGPVSGIIKNKKFIPRVKPLYFVAEKEIEQYSKIKNLPVEYIECPFSVDSLRKSIKIIFKELEKKDANIRKKIVTSFIKILPDLKQSYKNEKIIQYCSKCGEPAQKQICKTCKILQNLQ